MSPRSLAAYAYWLGTWSVLSSVLAGTTTAAAAAGADAGAGDPLADFDWTAITPSAELQYHPCYDGFRCARLAVPLDWLDADNNINHNNKTIAIAIISLPATVPSDDPSFGGGIITNPGGPGGSGVQFIQRDGRLLQKMTEGKKHYEIIGFDPRGVGYTTPQADCYGKTHAMARDATLLEQRAIGGLDASEYGLRRALSLLDGFGSLCATTDADIDILSYLSTASVARDIIEIADRAEEHRKAERASGTTSAAAAASPNTAQRPMGSEDEAVDKKQNRILYWGFSYGTVLGNTLVSMFPGRMGRVILDGVCDIRDYYDGNWLLNLLDTEKIVDYFYDTCFEAAEDCPLWTADDESSDDIRRRIDDLISEAEKSPISFVPSDGTANIRVITGHDILIAFRIPLYKPLPSAFEELALLLAETLRGNYTLIGRQLDEPRLRDACELPSENATPVSDEATAAILCGDSGAADKDTRGTGQGGGGDDEEDGKLRYWQSYIARLKDQSPTFGPFWSTIATSCSAWRIRPKWRFTGPFTSPPPDPTGLRDDAPAAPVLFTSSRLDPVTPLRNAYAMSNDHPDSAVLMLDTVGHCAMGNGWSECFNEAVRAYLDDGIVPKNGTVCADTTCKPFSNEGKCLAPLDVLSARGLDEGHKRPLELSRSHRPLMIPH